AQRRAALRRAADDDGGDMGGGGRRGAVGGSSAAGRIRGVGGGTQRSAVRVVFSADAGGVCAIRKKVVADGVRRHAAHVHAGVDEQADDRDRTVCVFVARLLAAEAASPLKDDLVGEGAVCVPGGGVVRGDGNRAAAGG